MGDGNGGSQGNSSGQPHLNAWMQNVLGINPALFKHPGLKEMPPLPVPTTGLAPAGSDAQSQAFRASVQQQLTVIDGHFAYLAAHAPADLYDPLVSKRETLLASFQLALKQIDPQDPAKAKGTLDQVVAAAGGVAARIAQARGDVESAFTAWQAQASKFDEAQDQVAELADWGDPAAAGFAKDVEAIRTQAESRHYKEALPVCAQLLTAVAPVVQTMRDQKAAMARYEPALKELQPRLDEAKACQFTTLAPLVQELGTIETQMTAAATAHDYLKAEPILADLKTKVDQCLQLRDELAAKKDAYDQAYAALQPRIPNTTEPGGEHIVALQQEIATKVPEMDGKYKAEDFDAALALVHELDGKITDLEAALAARRHYEDQRNALKDRIPQTPTNAAPLKDLEAKIAGLVQQSETEAAADDYERACADLTTLDATLAEYDAALTKFKEQKEAYEQAKAALEPHLPKASEPGGGRIAEVQNEIQKSLADASAAADAQDYGTALDLMHALETQLSEFEKLLAARDEYQAKRKEIDDKLPAGSEAAAGALADLLKQIEQLRASAEAAANESNFETAMDDLGQIEALLPKYQELVEQRDQFVARWAEVKPKVPNATEPDASPAILKILDTIQASCSVIEAVMPTSGDYAGGLTEIDKLMGLLADLTEAKEKEAQARANFEQAYAAIKPNVETALAAQTDVKEIKEKQDDLAHKKQALDDTVAKNDFATAQTQLADVQAALDAYLEETRKSPVNRDLVRDMANRLKTAIMRTYMTSQAKVDRAATAYDAALKRHQDAIAEVSAKKQLAADIAAGVFFAAIGGFAGGAAGALVKGPVEAAFKNKAVQGGIIDATKDVAKYLTRTADKARGKVNDPTAISAKVGGNGTELARGIGAAVNEQGAKLLETVEQWETLLINLDKADPSGGTVRVDLTEGDPYDHVVNDAFLKILDGITGTQIDFARALWTAWIEHNAYEVDLACSRAGCWSVVGDNAESFFAWWADLTKHIQEQTGEDFGLRAKLDTAKKVVQEEVDARNAKRHQGI